MLKITNDDNQLTDKVNKILNNDTENNVKKSTIDDYDSDLNKLRGALYSLLDEGNPDYEKYFTYFSQRHAKNKYTFVIHDYCGDNWVYDLIRTCAWFSTNKVTYYSLSDILKMPYDVACERLGDINLSEYEKGDDIYHNLGYIEKLKHITNCKFVLTCNDRGWHEQFFSEDDRVKYIELFIPSNEEYAERLNDFKDVYMNDVLREAIFDFRLFGNQYPLPNEKIESFWEGL